MYALLNEIDYSLTDKNYIHSLNCLFFSLIRVHWSVTIVCFMMFFECKGLEAVLSSCPFPIFILFFSHSFFGKKIQGHLSACKRIWITVLSFGFISCNMPFKRMDVCLQSAVKRGWGEMFCSELIIWFYRSPFQQQKCADNKNLQKCFPINRKLDSTQVSFKNKKIAQLMWGASAPQFKCDSILGCVWNLEKEMGRKRVIKNFLPFRSVFRERVGKV